MKSWERWVVMAALLVWPVFFALVINGPLGLEPWMSNLLLIVGWVVILGIFVTRIYRSSAFLRADVARERAAHPSGVVSAAILRTRDSSDPAEGSIVVLVADADGVRLIGRDSGVVGAGGWSAVLKISALDRNLIFLLTKPEGGTGPSTEEWRITPCETDFIRPVSVEKRDALFAELETLRAKAAQTNA